MQLTGTPLKRRTTVSAFDSVSLNAQSDVTTCVESEADVVWPATELVPNTKQTNKVIFTRAVRMGL